MEPYITVGCLVLAGGAAILVVRWAAKFMKAICALTFCVTSAFGVSSDATQGTAKAALATVQNHLASKKVQAILGKYLQRAVSQLHPFK